MAAKFTLLSKTITRLNQLIKSLNKGILDPSYNESWVFAIHNDGKVFIINKSGSV